MAAIKTENQSINNCMQSHVSYVINQCRTCEFSAFAKFSGLTKVIGELWLLSRKLIWQL